MAVVPGGYYLVAADGGVFNFGAAKFLGSTYSYGITGLSGSHPLNAPIVGIVPTPSGNGYWLVAKDGGIFDFGAAPFLGSTYTYGITGLSGKRPLNAPIVGAIASPSGQGYYMVAADGGVFNLNLPPPSRLTPTPTWGFGLSWPDFRNFFPNSCLSCGYLGV
jgi:hypothetical protein